MANLLDFEIPQSGKKYSLTDLPAIWRLVAGAAMFGIVGYFGRLVASEVDRRVRPVPLGMHEEPEPEGPAGIATY